MLIEDLNQGEDIPEAFLVEHSYEEFLHKLQIWANFPLEKYFMYWRQTWKY